MGPSTFLTTKAIQMQFSRWIRIEYEIILGCHTMGSSNFIITFPLTTKAKQIKFFE